MTESALRSSLDSLDAARSSLHGWMHFWTWFVVIGVALELVFVIWEYREELREFKHGIIVPPAKPNVWLLILGLIGAGMVTAGVTGELIIDAKLGRNETETQRINNELYSLLSREAGDAATSAKSAHDELDKVKKEAAALASQIHAASSTLLSIKPRWEILDDNKKKFITDLKPFGKNKTKIVVLSCGPGVPPFELWMTEQRIFSFLGKAGSNFQAANWDTEYEHWVECPFTTSNGIRITINGDASTNLKNAADALKDEFLKLHIAAGVHPVPSNQYQFWSFDGFGTDSPEARAAADATSIFLLVAPNAMAGSAKPSKKTTQRRN